MIDPGAFDALPSHLRIGAYDIAMVLEMQPKGDKGDAVFGMWMDAEHKIIMSLDHPSRLRAANTLMHEINHAIFSVCALGERDSEERICTALANGWCQVLRDNPVLLVWLGEMTREPS
jgi:hypothetical protein